VAKVPRQRYGFVRQMKPGEQRRLVVPAFALERYWHHHVRGYQASFAAHHFRQPL